jgi:hypothetical protein
MTCNDMQTVWQDIGYTDYNWVKLKRIYSRLQYVCSKIKIWYCASGIIITFDFKLTQQAPLKMYRLQLMQKPVIIPF